jgi:hypothetical protein
MSERLPIPEIDDEDLRAHILKLRGLVAEETIDTLRMVRLDHIVNPRGKMVEYDEQAFRAWVIAWLNALETVICAHLALLTKRALPEEHASLEPIVAHPKLLLTQVEDIRRALEIILEAEPEMTPTPATGEYEVLDDDTGAASRGARGKSGKGADD